MKPILQRELGTTKGAGPAVVGSLVLIAALFVILSKIYDDSAQKWAFGTVGMILGVTVS